MKFIFNILVIVCLIGAFGCSNSNKIILSSKTSSKQLVYDCNNFIPQVETPEDIGILLSAAGETLNEAATNSEIVTMNQISDAMKNSDWRKLEKVVVEYRCAHRNKD